MHSDPIKDTSIDDCHVCFWPSFLGDDEIMFEIFPRFYRLLQGGLLSSLLVPGSTGIYEARLYKVQCAQFSVNMEILGIS